MTTNTVRGLARRPTSGARRANVWMRVCVIVAVVAASLWAIWPPQQRIKLGLDLNGGVHLVLRVKPDSARATSPATRNDTVDQALHTIERRVNELGVAEAARRALQPGRSDSRAASGRDRRRAREADHQVHRAVAADARRARALSDPRVPPRPATRGSRPETSKCCPARPPSPRTPRRRSSIVVQKDAGRCRQRPARRPARRPTSSTGQPWRSR